MENDEEVILPNIIGYTIFKSQFYGYNEKIKNALKKGFRINEIVELTIKIDSSISDTNICYYLRLPMPILDKQILE